MGLDLQKECLHYLKKEKPSVSIGKLKAHIAWRQVFLRRFEMPYLEVFVTTHCNLKCKNCSNLIPTLSDKHHIDFTSIKNSMEALLSKINCLFRLKIHGGEAFLHPRICDLIGFFDKQDKIKSLRITTNGTLIPSDDILRRIAESKVVVQISDYTLVQSKVNELIGKFKQFGVKYVYLKNQEWYDMGDCLRRDTSRYDDCSVKRCTSLYDGKIYVCSRAAIMAKKGYVPDEGIDVNLTKKELRRKIKELYCGKFSEACSYCDGDTHFSHIVVAGEQAE